MSLHAIATTYSWISLASYSESKVRIHYTWAVLYRYNGGSKPSHASWKAEPHAQLTAYVTLPLLLHFWTPPLPTPAEVELLMSRGQGGIALKQPSRGVDLFRLDQIVPHDLQHNWWSSGRCAPSPTERALTPFSCRSSRTGLVRKLPIHELLLAIRPSSTYLAVSTEMTALEKPDSLSRNQWNYT
jgi:hypothetical protein